MYVWHLFLRNVAANIHLKYHKLKTNEGNLDRKSHPFYQYTLPARRSRHKFAADVWRIMSCNGWQQQDDEILETKSNSSAGQSSFSFFNGKHLLQFSSELETPALASSSLMNWIHWHQTEAEAEILAVLWTGQAS